jgi:UDP-N-acetylmuramoylalanine--D-glutamate ligase
VSLFFRYCPFPIYAVTGPRGKSTTTALLGEMFKTVNPKTVVAGNITRSPLEDLDWLLEEKEPVPVVIELSSWLIESLENVARGPDIGILTNIFPDHLNRYASLEAYAASKLLMFKNCAPGQKAVLNADHEMVRSLSSQVACKKYWFSENQTVDEGVFLRDGKIVCIVEGQEHELGDTATMALKGKHNLLNALAASLAAHLAGVPSDKIAAALRTFEGLPGRQEIVKEVRGVAYVNDTTATSPDGVIAALERFGKGTVLITGGTSKGLPYGEMGKKIFATCKYVVYLDGDATPAIQAAVGDKVPSVVVKSMLEAVQAASQVAENGDTVLMSPGAASFGMFKNEFDRGEQFVEAVKTIKEA